MYIILFPAMTSKHSTESKSQTTFKEISCKCEMICRNWSTVRILHSKKLDQICIFDELCMT